MSGFHPGSGCPKCPEVGITVFPEALHVLMGTVVAEAGSIIFPCSCAHDPEAEVSMTADSSLCLYQGVTLECPLPLFLPFSLHTPVSLSC